MMTTLKEKGQWNQGVKINRMRLKTEGFIEIQWYKSN